MKHAEFKLHRHSLQQYSMQNQRYTLEQKSAENPGICCPRHSATVVMALTPFNYFTSKNEGIIILNLMKPRHFCKVFK